MPGGKPAINVDNIITVFIKNSSECREIPVHERDVRQILRAVRAIFLEQPVFLELDAPVCICGDIHGQYTDLHRIFQTVGYPPKWHYLFLGDYVDRGKQSLETIIFLFCLKIKYPQLMFLLRGNHECEDINRVYGFYDEMNRRYPGGPGIKLWKSFQDVFSVMPASALVANRIFCMHGGLPKDLNLEKNDWSEILAIERPYEVPPAGIITDLLWADPGKEMGFVPNNRGVSHLFGPDVLQEFCESKDIDLIVRAHQVVERGYEQVRDTNGKIRLITLFSAPNYCGEFDNNGAIMEIKKNMTVRFRALRPLYNKGKMKKVQQRESTEREA